MEEVISQAPPNVSNDCIKEIFEKHNKNVLATLSELWDIKENVPKEKTKWETIRETCDEFDNEMAKSIKKTLVYDGNMLNTNIELK